MKNFIKATAGDVLNAGAEKLQCRHFAERASGTQIGDALWRFQRPASRHDFTPNMRHTGVFQWANICPLQTTDDLSLALRAIHRRAINLLNFTHFTRIAGATVEKRQQLFVGGINQITQFKQGFTH